MAHLALVTPPTAKTFIISKTSPRLHKVWACTTSSSTTGSSDQDRHVQRRSMALGLAGVVVGLSVGGGNARAAARRPPPPPPPPSAEEKKDPNMNGVIAKVVASKKRKEAMKESIAKLREKGKLIQDPSQ